MSWLELRLTVEADRVEAAEGALFERGAVAVTLLDAGDTPIHEPDPGEMPLWPVSVIQALFEESADPAALIQALENDGIIDGPGAVTLARLDDQDWERAWMDRFEPMKFGRNLWICPTHHEPDPGWAVVIRLDPGLAFGTGTHPTTALCLEWMDSQDFQGQTVIDFGCGSGVLAIAAALKGADRVIAVDHDPQALEATLANARLNGVDDRVARFLPDQAPEEPADTLLANILARPLMTLAPVLTRRTRPGGRLVLSGLLNEQEEAVEASYEAIFGQAAVSRLEGWSALVFQRPGSRVR